MVEGNISEIVLCGLCVCFFLITSDSKDSVQCILINLFLVIIMNIF